jgi:poly-gamma-glutamate synthase PgsB/CapB
VSVIISAGLLAFLLVLGAGERRARDRALSAVPIRIHVNGTRGKSTVTRLVAGALREAGIPTLAKTTGTAPRLILPDGSERVIRRRAPASIREQLWFMREARRLKASAVVVECMAVDPDLQAITEHEMIRATIGVITNARLDHGDVMGATVEQVAEALAATIPDAGVLVLGPTSGLEILERVACARGTRVVHAPAGNGAGAGAGPAEPAPPWVADNVQVALAVTRLLGIDDALALRGMRSASPDPGAVHAGAIAVAGRRVAYIDASAANDPASLGQVLGERTLDAVFVFQHRADRPHRLRQFADLPPWTRDADRVLITGARPDWMTWRRLRRRLPGPRLAYASSRHVAADLRRRLLAWPGGQVLVLCGNTKGLNRERVLTGIERG